MGTIQLPPDFKEFLKLLNSSDVEYLVVGGYAVNYHGFPRATADLNIWIAMSRENAERVAQAVRRFGFEQAEAAQFLQPRKVIRMGAPPVRLEILTAISGVDFAECYERRRGKADPPRRSQAQSAGERPPQGSPRPGRTAMTPARR